MCPACVGSFLLAVAVAASAGGVTGLVVKELRSKSDAGKVSAQANLKEDST